MDNQSRRRSNHDVIKDFVNFDTDFYAAQHPDLANMRRLALFKHYALRGRTEGRAGSFKEAATRAEADHGALPTTFDIAAYRRYNPDLAASFAKDLDLLVHFLRHGYAEGRRYSRFDVDFYQALYRPDWPIDAFQLETDWRTHQNDRFASWPDMLEAFGFSYGPWVDLIQPIEFSALNSDWAVDVETRPRAALAFVREGWRRLAPLSLDARFDPKFYRERHEELSDAEDWDLYKDWLINGVARREAGTPKAYLRQLGLKLSRYPEAFSWDAYISVHPDGGPDRWSALKHLTEHGVPQEGALPLNKDGRRFLSALSDAYAERGNDGSAVLVLNLLRQTGLLSSTARQHLGDAYFRLKLWMLALAEYELLIDSGHYSQWTVFNAVTCVLQLGDQDKALDLLSKSQNRLEGEQLWLVKLDETTKAAFASASFKAQVCYGEGKVADGDSLLARAVDKIVDQLTTLAPLGAQVRAHPDGRVVILANQHLRQCTHYRVEQKAELFEVLGRPCQIFDGDDVAGFLQALPGASAAIVYRLIATPDVVKAILTARALGVATYYEIDDLVFDSAVYPPPIETYGGQVSGAVYNGLRYGAPLTRAAMALCDYGIASTQALAAQMAPVVLRRQCFTIKNGLDSRNEDYLLEPSRRPEKQRVTIFYGSGTLAHNTDFLALAGPALIELLEQDERIRLVIVGYLVLDEAFAPFQERIERIEFLPNARAYWSELAKADINLAVLEPGVISDCKSEIKWLEAAVFGVPSIVSPTATYREVLEDGCNVVFAADEEGWRTALRRLVTDSDLRETIGGQAKLKAASFYSRDAGARSLEAALALADASVEQAPPTPRKLRVLIVNVYFPPQTIGGATRVVRDNIDSWIASGDAGDLDLAVVCSDNEAEPSYRLRMDAYRGLPVFRIATPKQVNMDWRPLDPEVGAVFASILESWTPDLVHFHATQRLTASCLEGCRDAGVPYLVTVHDAWWVSDWQFLTDEEGLIHAPGTPLLKRTETGITPLQSKARLDRLEEDLQGAKAVLAVSESFAELYRKAGVKTVLAVPNGLPRLTPHPRRPSKTGRVRLGHVGGMSIHKGFHLVYAALLQGGFTNLELTIVDHHPREEAEDEVWGTTPVQIIGRTPQGSVENLYAELDVLLAPSIWPESYGLVSREALACGLWVVASDRGAMGEDVKQGENGFVIDVSSVSDLSSVLAEIDRNPSRYLQSPTQVPNLRTADDQARDLLQLYRTMLEREKRPKSTEAV